MVLVSVHDFEVAIAEFDPKARLFIDKTSICILYRKPKLFDFKKKKALKEMKKYIDDYKLVSILVIYATYEE